MNTHNFDSLRQKAEEKLSTRHPSKPEPLSEADSMKLIHELDVYHVELEMQNDELRQARDDAKKVFEKYATLYEFAYTGYFSLMPDGTIFELNPTSAKMLGLEADKLIKQNLREYVTLDYRANFNDFLKNVFKSHTMESTEIRFKRKGNPSAYVHLEGRANQDKKRCQIIVIDESRRKRIEEVLSLKTLENQQCNDLMQMSDLHIVDLKKEIYTLRQKLGEKGNYPITDIGV